MTEARKATDSPWRRVLPTVGTAAAVVGVQISVPAGAISWALVPWVEGAFL